MNCLRCSLTCVTLAALLAGCASPSIWERRFEPAEGVVTAPIDARAAPVPVSLRRVPWERLDGARTELESELAASDAPFEEWTVERRRDADARLLRALQVTQAPESVRILGVSEFRTTAFDRPDENDLADLASAVGGDTVVWTSRHLGKADAVVQQPVTSTSTWTGWYGRGGRTRTFSESTTTFVPVKISADQYEFVAFVLRTR
ncbi:MAG: hypothetical protein ACKVZJ_10085 [Phycisphaerales bacterium]